MQRMIGTQARGIRAPIIREGDDLAAIVVESVCSAAQAEGFSLRDRDVVGIPRRWSPEPKATTRRWTPLPRT